MIAAPETDQNVQIQQVPTQPLAIRQVTVPTTTDPTTTDATNPAASRTADLTTADPTTGVEMGNVSVPAEYAGVIAQASASSGTPAPLLAAVLSTESGFDPAAVSPAGAEGIAQFMPSTATANGVNPFDPTSAIIGAASLLAQYHAAFGSWSDAVAAYNAGGGAVEQAGGVPDNGKTPAYVTQVLSAAGMEPVS
jgi:soluble lytic murein transglycosylase-like protein